MRGELYLATALARRNYEHTNTHHEHTRSLTLNFGCVLDFVWDNKSASKQFHTHAQIRNHPTHHKYLSQHMPYTHNQRRRLHPCKQTHWICFAFLLYYSAKTFDIFLLNKIDKDIIHAAHAHTQYAVITATAHRKR